MVTGEAICRDERRLGVLALALGVAAITLVLYAAHSSLPFNALRLPYGRELAPFFVKLAPESWKFFTRDPQDQRIWLYVKDEAGAWQPANLGPNGRLSQRLGASRRARAQGVEAGLLLAALSPEAWTSCDGESSACLDRSSPPPAVHATTTPAPSLCGDVGFVVRKPLPWAWANHPDRHRMPARVARLRVSC